MVLQRRVIVGVGAFLAAVAGGDVCALGIGQDVSYVGAYVNVNYVQVGSGVPVVAAGNPFDMEISVTETAENPNSVSGPTVTGAGGLNAGLAYEGDRYWGYEEHYATAAAMETARGGSSMTVSLHGVHDGDVSVNVGITDGNLFADAPHITDMTALQAADPTQEVTITCDPLTYNSGAFFTDGSAGIAIFDASGAEVYEQDEDDDVRLPVVVPAGVLLPGEDYTAELTAYLIFSGGRTQDNYPTGSAWNATTVFSIQTVPEPGSLGVIGVGALVVGWRRRR